MNTSVKSRPKEGLLVFFGTVIAFFLLAAIITAANGINSFMSIFSTRFLGIFIEAVPFLLLGSLVSGLLDVFVSSEDLARLLPRNPILAALAGTFMGFLFPVCECGVVPVVRRLYNKGLPISIGISFLLASPVINPIVLASTYVAFGWGPILIGRFLITALVAAVVGLIFALSARPEDVLRPASLSPLAQTSIDPYEMSLPSRAPGFLEKIQQALLSAGDEFFDMGRYLILGSLLAALMQTLVSQEMLLTLGKGPLISVITMQLLAYILSICSTVDAFLALAFVGSFTGGSILAFLTFGPMVDIKSTLMYMGIFRPRIVLYLIFLPLLMTTLIAVWLNLNWFF